MTVELHRFQKADLAWMQFREQSNPAALSGVSADESGVAETPDLPVGGIYANEPGLGKTVTTIALILAQPRKKVRVKHQSSA